MVEKSCNDIPDIVEILDLEKVLHVVEEKDLETLINFSIETLKCSNTNYGKEEVFYLLQESVQHLN